MIAGLLSTLFLASPTPCGAQPKLAASVAPTGALQELTVDGEVVGRDIALLVVKPGWNGMWLDQRRADPAALRRVLKEGATSLQGQLPTEGGFVDLEETVAPEKDGVRVSYQLTPSIDLTTEAVVLSTQLPAAAAAGTARWYAYDGISFRSELFPPKVPDPYHLVGGMMEWIGWTLPSGQGVRFNLAQSSVRSASLQDDRQWNMDLFELHLIVGTRLIKAGERVALDVLLQPLAAREAEKEQAAVEEEQRKQVVTFSSAAPLRLGEVTLPREPIAQFGRLELTLDLSATYDNPFDPADIDVRAEFAAPDGQRLVVPAFFYVPYERTVVNGQERVGKTGDPVWRVRFTPAVVGRYQCTVSAKDRSGTVRSKPAAFTVAAKKARGFVRRSPSSPYYLRFDSGEPYFAVGENVCWGGGRQTLDYDEWFPALGAARGNYARIWLVRWNMGLEWTERDAAARGRFYGLGRYSPDNAWRLDYVMDLAERAGVYVMLCLGYHGELMDQRGYFGEQCWDANPYNKANGGPCEKPADFWTNEQARRLYQQRLRYYIARWGYSPNVLSFEFWNEVNAPAPWVDEMAKYLRANDPFRHLITTTYGNADVWRIPEIDYTQTHTYGTGEQRHDCVEEIARLCRTHTEEFGKPHMVGEFGIDWQKSDRDHDPEGQAVNLHNGLWASMASRGMGGAAIWYWDGYVHPLNLYGEFTALSRFAADVPWPELDFRLADTTAPTRTTMAGEKWGDLTVQPGMGWGKSTGSDFTVDPQGKLTGQGVFAQFLYSPGKPAERAPLRFHVTCPQGGKLTMHVATVSTRALLQVAIDGQPAWEHDFRAGPEGQGEYKETKWQEQWQLWQSLFDKAYTVDIPAGEHAVDLSNAEGDWIEIDQYVFAGCVDPKYATHLDVLGLQTDDMAILWLHNQASNWYNRAQKLAIPPVPEASFDLRGLKDGDYLIEWCDTKTGQRSREERVKCADGKLTVTGRGIETDVACKVRKAVR
jgi:Domain of unknown function (DUF5060)